MRQSGTRGVARPPKTERCSLCQMGDDDCFEYKEGDLQIVYDPNGVEALRCSFRPDRIIVLFVGESAPYGGNFFYDGNTQLFRHMKRAFKGGEDFLSEFRNKGYYLDDLVLTPINNRIRSERRRLHRASIPSLTHRISDYRPLAIVTLMLGVKDAVDAAIAGAGLSHVLHYGVPFPGNGQQTRFAEAMAKIIPALPHA